MSRSRITADNEFSMFSPEQMIQESRPSHKVAMAWGLIVIATSLFWSGMFTIVTWMSY